MTKNEWLKEAERYENMAQAAFANKQDSLGEYYCRKAAACRHNACYGTEE